jgi:hypothetical protein
MPILGSACLTNPIVSTLNGPWRFVRKNQLNEDIPWVDRFLYVIKTFRVIESWLESRYGAVLNPQEIPIQKVKRLWVKKQAIASFCCVLPVCRVGTGRPDDLTDF